MRIYTVLRSRVLPEIASDALLPSSAAAPLEAAAIPQGRAQTDALPGSPAGGVPGAGCFPGAFDNEASSRVSVAVSRTAPPHESEAPTGLLRSRTVL